MQSFWRDGAFVPPAEAIDASDRGLLLGDAVFDTALVVGGTVFQREAHVRRLAASLDFLEIDVPRAAIDEAFDALCEYQRDGTIRLTVTRGPAPRGIRLPPNPRPTLLGSCGALAAAAMFLPLRATICDIRRNETSPLASIKSTAYLDAVLATRAAERSGASEAIFLNTRGNVACTALGNVFAISGDTLITPPLADGVLPGIMRAWILDHASGVGLQPVERSIPSYRLAAMDAVFATNSLRLVSPIAIDLPASGARISERLRRLMERLCDAIGDECGADPQALGAILPAASAP